MKHRFLNALKAKLLGYYWLPCRRCGQMYGGHEHLPDGNPTGAVHMDDGTSWTICPDCTLELLATTGYSSYYESTAEAHRDGGIARNRQWYIEHGYPDPGPH